jgi:hypothetical protein
MAAVMPFGRHRGKCLTALPDGYLKWLLQHCDLEPWLLSEVRSEAARRGQKFAVADELLADLEERITQAVAEDGGIDHATAGRIGDHLLAAFQGVREDYGVVAETELMLKPQRPPRRFGEPEEDRWLSPVCSATVLPPFSASTRRATSTRREHRRAKREGSLTAYAKVVSGCRTWQRRRSRRFTRSWPRPIRGGIDKALSRRSPAMVVTGGLRHRMRVRAASRTSRAPPNAKGVDEMVATLKGEHKPPSVVLEKIHPTDLLLREEKIAADPNVQIDLGIGMEAQQFVQTVGDLAHFLDHAQQLGDGLHLLQLEGTAEELFLFRRGRFAELGSLDDLSKVFDPAGLDEAIAELRKVGAE